MMNALSHSFGQRRHDPDAVEALLTSLAISTSRRDHDPRATVDADLHRCGLTRAELGWPSITVAAGEQLVAPMAWPSEATLVRHTPRLREYKGWIGTRDDEASGLVPVALAGERPPAPHDPCWAQAPLPIELRRRLERVAEAYIFGDARPWEEYRDLIESLLGPFPTTLLTARRIEIQPGATLHLDGPPVLLLADELTLHEPGQLVITCCAHIGIGRLTKIRCKKEMLDEERK